MKKEIILEINDTSIKCKELLKKGFLYKEKKVVNSSEFKYMKNNYENIKVDFKNKNLFIIVGGEEIYVKFMTLPKVKDEKLYEIIKNELKNRFQNIDNIMFTYEIFKELGNSLEVIVFCLNWNKIGLIETYVEKGAQIKGIFPIQFKILDSYRKNIKEREYAVIFIYEDLLYFIACIEGKIVTNSIIKEFNEKNFLSIYENFKIKYEMLGFKEKLKNIYFLNFPYKHLIDCLSEKYNCKNLDDYFQGNIDFI